MDIKEFIEKRGVGDWIKPIAEFIVKAPEFEDKNKLAREIGVILGELTGCLIKIKEEK